MQREQGFNVVVACLTPLKYNLKYLGLFFRKFPSHVRIVKIHLSFYSKSMKSVSIQFVYFKIFISDLVILFSLVKTYQLIFIFETQPVPPSRRAPRYAFKVSISIRSGDPRCKPLAG